LPLPFWEEGRETVEEEGEAGGVSSSSSSEESLVDAVETQGGVPTKVELDEDEDDEESLRESERGGRGSEVKVGSFEEKREGRTSRIIVTSD